MRGTIRRLGAIPAVLLLVLLAGGGQADAQSASTPNKARGIDVNASGTVGVEGRYFPFSPAFPRQRDNTWGFYAVPEFDIRLENNHRFLVRGFGRYDRADKERSHIDLRQAVYLAPFKGGEVRIGVDKVFWGVTESLHLVDIINQTDLVENSDTEDKLGQPMVHLTLDQSWGTAEFFYLPFFRTRTFPGPNGRLRSQPIVDTDRPVFDSDHERWHPSFAARYSNTIGDLDFGLSYFRGLNRDPTLRFNGNPFNPAFLPVYELIHQASIDAQYTTGPWLLKLEALYRDGQRNLFASEEDYGAWAAGFEYTFFSAFGRKWDIGVLAEHLYDSRKGRATTFAQNDIFGGLRWSFNDPKDSTILFGVIQDLEGPERNFFVEASRRLNRYWRISVEGRFFTNLDNSSVLFPIRRDDHIQMDLTLNY